VVKERGREGESCVRDLLILKLIPKRKKEEKMEQALKKIKFFHQKKIYI
jgi:hypothetical protein